MAEHNSLLSVWRVLSDAPKSHHLTALQRAFGDTAWRLGIRPPIVATPGLLKITLSLIFHLNHRYNLGTGLHQVCIGQHSASTRNILKARVQKHQVIADRGGAPTLASNESRNRVGRLNCMPN